MTSTSSGEEIERAAGVLRAGGLVAFPTETVYGLGANALDREAVDRIYAVKQRPASSPLIVHVSSAAMAREVVAEWPEAAERLAARFWPGPLTLVLPKRSVIPANVTAGLSTVGVRVPNHPVALRLIELAGVPVAAPSANRFMGLSPTLARHVAASLAGVDMILDGGPAAVGIESTVLLLAGKPLLLRPGMVSREMIEAEIGAVGMGCATDGVHASPGLHPRHYAPKTPLRTGYPKDKGGAYLWWRSERAAGRSVRMPADPEGYATLLYGVLHELDALGVPEIVVEPVPSTSAWDGIRDRLARAAAE